MSRKPGYKHSAETRRKMSEAHKGVRFSEERREAIRRGTLRRYERERRERAELLARLAELEAK